MQQAVYHKFEADAGQAMGRGRSLDYLGSRCRSAGCCRRSLGCWGRRSLGCWGRRSLSCWGRFVGGCRCFLGRWLRSLGFCAQNR